MHSDDFDMDRRELLKGLKRFSFLAVLGSALTPRVRADDEDEEDEEDDEPCAGNDPAGGSFVDHGCGGYDDAGRIVADESCGLYHSDNRRITDGDCGKLLFKQDAIRHTSDEECGLDGYSDSACGKLAGIHPEDGKWYFRDLDCGLETSKDVDCGLLGQTAQPNWDNSI